MRQETVFRVAVLAAVVSGALCVLAHFHIDHLTGLAAGRRADPWSEFVSVVPAWVLLAGAVGSALGIWFGILPTIVGVTLWPALESRLGTARAVAALSALVAVIVMGEVLASDGEWGWAIAVATICGLTSGYLLWLNAFVLDRTRASQESGWLFPEQTIENEVSGYEAQ